MKLIDLAYPWLNKHGIPSYGTPGRQARQKKNHNSLPCGTEENDVQHSLQGKAVLMQLGEENLQESFQSRGQQDVYNNMRKQHHIQMTAQPTAPAPRPGLKSHNTLRLCFHSI